jgi:hypothetical protein
VRVDERGEILSFGWVEGPAGAGVACVQIGCGFLQLRWEEGVENAVDIDSGKGVTTSILASIGMHREFSDE